MTAAELAADRALELTGPAVRRFTRRAAAARAETSIFARLGDVVGTLTSIVVVVAVVGGTLARLRSRIAGARPTLPGATVPAGVSVAAVAVLTLAALLVLLERLGPVSSTPAAAAWWLPLPAGRRGLLRGELARVGSFVVAGTVVLALPVVLAAPRSPSAAAAVIGIGWVAGIALLGVGTTAALQVRGGSGRLAGVAGAVAVAVAVLSAAASVAAASGAHRLALPAPAHTPAWTPLVPAGVGVVLLLVADRGLGRLSAEQLRAGGRTAQYASASVLSLDTRELGRALSARQSAPRRGWRFGWVTRPWSAVVAGDLAILSRGRWQLGQLLVAAALPVVAGRTAGLRSLPWLVWGGCLLGWALAAVAAGHPSRQAQAAPVLDRMLPLSAADVIRARAALPLGLTSVVCTLTLALLGIGTGDVVLWALLGLAVSPAWAAAAVRGAYRPELDWSAPLLSTPAGPVPTGVGATLVQGLDAGLAGSVPVAIALLQGRPTPGLVVGQAVWSAVVAAVAFALLRRRAEQPRA